MWGRLTSWRFALLVGLTVLDAVVFLAPLVAIDLNHDHIAQSKTQGE